MDTAAASRAAATDAQRQKLLVKAAQSAQLPPQRPLTVQRAPNWIATVAGSSRRDEITLQNSS
jgi:hypothetical protein